MMPKTGIYCGPVSHVRYQPVKNTFTYQYTMLGIELNNINQLTNQSVLFGRAWYKPLRFNEKDYLKSEPGNLTQRINNKVKQLGGDWQGDNIFMLVQCRTLGVYFSPINFYYCYDNNKNCVLLLVEVSNTPWNERHYYLVDMRANNSLDGKLVNDKRFHVSPFMDMNMKYQWQVPAPSERVKVIINNLPKHNSESPEPAQGKNRFFTAAMSLKKYDFSIKRMFTAWFTLPFTVIKMLILIYWQALKLWYIGVPFVPYKK